MGKSYSKDLRDRVISASDTMSSCDSGTLVAFKDFLVELVESQGDITLRELSQALEEAHGHRAHHSSIYRLLKALGFSYKKTLLARGTDRSYNRPGFVGHGHFPVQQHFRVKSAAPHHDPRPVSPQRET